MKKAFKGIFFLMALLWVLGINALYAHFYDWSVSALWAFDSWDIGRRYVSHEAFLTIQIAFLFGLLVMKLGRKHLLPVLFGLFVSAAYLLSSVTMCKNFIWDLGNGILLKAARSVWNLNRDLFEAVVTLDEMCWKLGGAVAGVLALLYGGISLLEYSGKNKKVQNEEEDTEEFKQFFHPDVASAPMTAQKAEIEQVFTAANIAAPAAKEQTVACEPVQEVPAAAEIEEAPVVIESAKEPETPKEDVPEPEKEIPVQPIVPPVVAETVQPPAKPVRKAPVQKDPMALNRLKKLAELYQMGILSDEEFSEKKKELLEKI